MASARCSAPCTLGAASDPKPNPGLIPAPPAPAPGAHAAPAPPHAAAPHWGGATSKPVRTRRGAGSGGGVGCDRGGRPGGAKLGGGPDGSLGGGGGPGGGLGGGGGGGCAPYCACACIGAAPGQGGAAIERRNASAWLIGCIGSMVDCESEPPCDALCIPSPAQLSVPCRCIPSPAPAVPMHAPPTTPSLSPWPACWTVAADSHVIAVPPVCVPFARGAPAAAVAPSPSLAARARAAASAASIVRALALRDCICM
eukprot:6189497-Pleurochrysis_carterae.AAC.2